MQIYKETLLVPPIIPGTTVVQILVPLGTEMVLNETFPPPLVPEILFRMRVMVLLIMPPPSVLTIVSKQTDTTKVEFQTMPPPSVLTIPLPIMDMLLMLLGIKIPSLLLVPLLLDPISPTLLLVPPKLVPTIPLKSLFFLLEISELEPPLHLPILPFLGLL